MVLKLLFIYTVFLSKMSKIMSKNSIVKKYYLHPFILYMNDVTLVNIFTRGVSKPKKVVI